MNTTQQRMERVARDHLRRLCLSALYIDRPAKMHESVLVAILRDVYPATTKHGLRRELDYLQAKGWVKVEVRKLDDAWFAALTVAGIDQVEQGDQAEQDAPAPTPAPRRRSGGWGCNCRTPETIDAPALPLPAALRLIHEWADAAGVHATFLDRADLEVEMEALAWPDAGKRAHLRCAAQLLQRCVSASGKQPAELFADLDREDAQ